MTIREYKGNLEGKKLCYIGDGNNMANSLIVGCLKVGMKISVACPKGYEPDLKVIDFAKDNPNFLLTEDIYEVAKNDCIVLHCLPAHREEEITAEVFEKHAKEIFDEAENRLHAQKAVMVLLMAD